MERGKECCDGGDFDLGTDCVLQDVSALDWGAGGCGVWEAASVQGLVVIVPAVTIGGAGMAMVAEHGQLLQDVVGVALTERLELTRMSCGAKRW